MRRLIAPVTCCAVALLVAACSPDAKDFRESAEDYIEGDLTDDLSPQIGEAVEFDDAACQEPDSTEVGTTYTCTADGDDGHAWEFEVEITGDRDLIVIRACQPGSDTPLRCPTDTTGTEPSGATPADPTDTDPAETAPAGPPATPAAAD